MSLVVKAKRKQNDEGITMGLKLTKHLWKRGLSMALSAAMAVTLLPAVPASAAVSGAAGQKPQIFKAGSVPATKDTVTKDEPYAAGTAGSQKFRIPCLITLENGDLLSVVDARWTTVKDGGGLDNMASVSSDGGKTWNYSFPLFFPDSDGYVGTPAANPKSSKATTIIDPGIVEGPDGTIYCFVDVNPTNCTTQFKTINTGTGYVTVNGKRYLALTDQYENVEIEPTDEEVNLTVYPYYVDDFDDEGYAKIRRRDNSVATDYVVDEWYNIYRVDENGVYQDDLKQKQIIKDNGETNNVDIQQNCYYENSIFHVYSIGYIWLLTSKNHGRTWEAPRNINDQVKRHENENAILVSPGRGLTTSDGAIVMGFYNSNDGEENASLVWSDDNGATWKRSNDVPGKDNGGFQTSENEIVELSDGTLRMFLRNQTLKLSYADAVRDAEGNYVFSAPVKTDLGVSTDCNLSAITYSKKIDGKQVVLISCPGTDRRKDGKIFTFLINEDEKHTMELVHTFSVPRRISTDNTFAYSCLTELEDGSVAILWEPNSGDYMWFDLFDIGDIVPYEFDVVNVELSEGEIYTRNYNRKNGSGITVPADEEIVEISLDDNGISIKALVDRGYTEAVIDGIQYKINILDNTTVLSIGDMHEIADIETEPGKVTGDAATIEIESTQTGCFFSHESNANDISAFSSKREREKHLSEAEFTFTASGNKWNIYNDYTKQYLTVNGAVEYFENNPVNMTVTKEADSNKFTITNGKRYALFWVKGGMVFDAATGLNADLDAKMTLLEKQSAVSEDDLIPGYKTASSITNGKKYLIAYLYDNNVIVLYPENGQTNQTKLVKSLPIYKVTVTAEKVGKSSITIGGKVYTFKVLADDCEHEEKVRKGAIAESCLTEGYEGDLYCANPDCGIFLEEGDVIPAFGDHDWDEGTIIKEVTETENGEKVYTCKHDSFHTKTETIYASVYAAMQQEYREVDKVLKNMYGLYTEETLEELERICEEYKAVLEDKGASYSQMNNAAAAFQTAKAALEQKNTDDLKEELRTACEEAEPDYRANETNLGTAWTEFSEAYDAATADSNNADAEELWRRIHALDITRTALLEARVSNAKTALQNAVKSAKSKHDAGKDSYTLATWPPFDAAYQAASNPPADADAAALKKLLDDLITTQNALKDAGSQTGTEPQTGTELQKGAQATDAAGTYEVTDAAKKEVTLIKGNDTKNVTVPAEIPVNGINCKVVAIGSNAFKNAKKLKRVIIGDNVTSIGSQAFSNCKKLSSVTLGANVTTIEKKTFFKSKKLKAVTLQGTAAPSIGKQSFKGTASKVTVKASKIDKAQRKKLLAKMKSAGKMSKKSVIR